MLKKSDAFVNSNLDSALYYSKKANQLINNLTVNSNKVEVYTSLGSIYLGRSNYALALDNYIKASNITDDQLLKEPRNPQFLENKVGLLIKLGNLNSQQNNLDKALMFYNKALLELDKANFNVPRKIQTYKVKIFNNIAGILTAEKKYEKALGFLTSARDINVQLHDRITDSVLLNNAGICYLQLKDYTLGIYYFEQSLAIRKSQKDLRGIDQCYNNMGEAYIGNQKFSEAENYLKQALEIGKKSGYSASMMISLESLSVLYDRIKTTDKAYSVFKTFTKLKDSLYNVQTVKRVAQLEMNYRLERQKNSFELNIKEKEAEKTRTKVIYISIATGLLLMLAIAALLIYLQKSKITNIELSNDKLELERINFHLEKENRLVYWL